MLETCNTFAESNYIDFNARKIICIKFSGVKKLHQKALLKEKELRKNNVRHPG